MTDGGNQATPRHDCPLCGCETISNSTDTVLFDVGAERVRQDAKWGGRPGVDRRDDHTYAAVLGEEFGEACQAWLQREVQQLRAELIQVAAVAVAWVEEIDNGGGLERSRFAPMPSVTIPKATP